jgi:hypothetical protein
MLVTMPYLRQHAPWPSHVRACVSVCVCGWGGEGCLVTCHGVIG